jgi:hypothetical protein
MQPIWLNTLSSWAKGHNYKLASAKYAIWKKGPFSWTTMTSQGVYSIVVIDTSGNFKSGWARISNWPNCDVDSNVEVYCD